MTTDLIEKVAKAISRRVGSMGDPEAIEQQRVSRDWQGYELHAKAAIDTIRAEIGRVTATVADTLAEAQLRPGDITAVFLTGGSTAIPLARHSILALAPEARVVEGDAFGSVGLGLALDARRKFA